MNTVKCCNCNWQGIEDDLTQFDDIDGGGYGCPNCHTDKFLMDIESKSLQAK